MYVYILISNAVSQNFYKYSTIQQVTNKSPASVQLLKLL